jgi:hypothetical protein
LWFSTVGKMGEKTLLPDTGCRPFEVINLGDGSSNRRICNRLCWCRHLWIQDSTKFSLFGYAGLSVSFLRVWTHFAGLHWSISASWLTLATFPTSLECQATRKEIPIPRSIHWVLRLDFTNHLELGANLGEERRRRPSFTKASTLSGQSAWPKRCSSLILIRY